MLSLPNEDGCDESDFLPDSKRRKTTDEPGANPDSSESDPGGESDDDSSDDDAKTRARNENQGMVEETADNSDSDSSSSSSSESDSDSEEEEQEDDEPVSALAKLVAGNADLDKFAIDVQQENLGREENGPQEPEVDYLDIARQAVLKRDELVKMLGELPIEAAEAAIRRCFVRLAVQARARETNDGDKDQDASSACVLAEVVGLEPSRPYEVRKSDGNRASVRYKLKCKRGVSEKVCPISSISNRELTETEHEQWSKLVAQTGVEVTKLHSLDMVQKTADLQQARNFRFDERVVSAMLARKGNVEFNAQKESRMRFLVQCATSQMDTSGIRDSDVFEIEQHSKDALQQLQMQEAKSMDTQAQWFEKRPKLFSLKMINKKNYDRQVKADRHALDYTLSTETSQAQTMNPFQRRACRPLVAWDTELTKSEGLLSPGAVDVSDGGKGNENAAGKVADENCNESQQLSDPQRRLERMVRAHSGARHILASISAIS